MLIDVGKTSVSQQQEGKTSRLLKRKGVFSWAPLPQKFSSLFSLRFGFQRFIYGSTAPWLMLVFVILMAVASCSRVSSGKNFEGPTYVSPPVTNTSNYNSKNGSLKDWGVNNTLKPFSNWILVGKGTGRVSGRGRAKNGKFKHISGCGELTWLYNCSSLECSKPHYGGSHCMQRDCPKCYLKWLIKSSDSITARLLSEASLTANKDLRLVEADISIPIEKYPTSMADFKVLRKEANAYAISIGFKGGVMVPHPFRTTEGAKEMAHQANKAKWEWIHDQDDWRVHTRLSYHFHVIGFITWLKKQEKGYKVWQYGSVTDQDNSPIDLLKEPNTEKRLKQRCKYLLSHTAVPEEEAGKFRSFNYFGSCSYNKFGVTEEERAAVRTGEPPVRYCKVCFSELMPAWDWVRIYYGAILNGILEPPKYWDEIYELMHGEPPPKDAKDFLVDDPSGEEGKGG